MRKVKHLIAAALLSISASSHAEFIDGNLLLSRILGSNNEVVFSLGYVTGVADATNGNLWCATSKITSNDILELTKRALIAVPAKRSISGDVFVVAALTRAFPCPSKSAPSGSVAL